MSQARFEEYKLLVEETARMRGQRQSATHIFMTVNATILGFLAFILKDVALTSWWTVTAVLPLIIAGVVISLFWRQSMAKHHALSQLRESILREMEQGMPGSARPYRREDELYVAGEGGKGDRTGRGLSRLEGSLPTLFIVLYVAFAVTIAVATALVLAGVLPAPVLV